jgi:hypothetical protein
MKRQLQLRQDERSLTYEYDGELGWFPIKSSNREYRGQRVLRVNHNSRGFRDPEHIIDGKPSIVFLGDSFVWGYDVDASERFVDLLRLRLPGWSLYNLGVSGYGTDQEYLLLKRHYDFYRPDIVFLVFCVDNDRIDNTHNHRYGGYYKPYFLVDEEGNLQLQGTPVPKLENFFFASHPTLSKSYWFRLFVKVYFKIVNPPDVEVDDPTHTLLVKMNEFVRGSGAKFIVGLQDNSPELEAFLEMQSIPYENLANDYRYPDPGHHWTPEGNIFVSEKIYDFLLEGGYLK